MVANEVVVVIVRITVAAYEWTIVALEFTVQCAFMLFLRSLLFSQPAVLFVNGKTAIEALPDAAQLGYWSKN